MTPPESQAFLLVASPELMDPNFRQSVVLILNHDAEGSFGLVLNRPLERRLAEVLPEVEVRAADVPLYQGGPVQTDMLQFVSDRGACGRPILPGVVAGAGLEDLLASSPEPAAIRAYVGYAGWGSGQLQRETEEGSWIIATANARHVFDVPAQELWSQVLKELGGQYAWMALKGGRPDEN